MTPYDIFYTIMFCTWAGVNVWLLSTGTTEGKFLVIGMGIGTVLTGFSMWLGRKAAEYKHRRPDGEAS